MKVVPHFQTLLTQIRLYLFIVPVYRLFNPIVLRKAKIVYNFGLSECDRVNIIHFFSIFQGENRFIESICQTIFKIPELLKVVNNPNISDNLKRPFLRFFLWVYLNTASGMIESGAGDIPHDP